MNRKLWVGVALLGLFAAGSASAQGGGVPSERMQKWEGVLFTRYQFEQSFDVGGGSTVNFDDDFGWGLGFNYNMNEKLNLGGDFAWNFINYDAQIGDNGIPPSILGGYGGTLDTGSAMFNVTFHLMPKKITPYINGGLGWGWYDTNIVAGISSGCYWDPWWGYVCGNYPVTYGDDAFVYRLGGGLRYDSPGTFFLKLGYNSQWADVGGNLGTPRADQIRIDFGGMMH
ncbi:MAG: outer membrane protein [Candidatus Eiseniibacteriota bacterium]